MVQPQGFTPIPDQLSVQITFLGEIVHVYHLVGGAMTVAGIVLVQKEKPSPKPATAAGHVEEVKAAPAAKPHRLRHR
jgi:hypothetical protein